MTPIHLLLAVALPFLAGHILAAPTYSLADLGTLGGSSTPLGINDSGQVVGYSSVSTNTSTDRAVLFSRTASPQDLGTLGGANSYAYSINNSGQVVGYAYTTNGSPLATLFSASGGPNTNLGTLGGTRSAALAINDNGLIVGEATTLGDITSRATLFNSSTGQNIDLGSIGGNSSSANGINNNGQIVGYSYLTDSPLTRATLFSGTGSPNLDLGTLTGGVASVARAINNTGQIVGDSYNPYTTPYFPNAGPAWNLRATLFNSTGSSPIDLGTLGGANSRAWDVNDSGQVVGQAQLASGEWDAFIWQGGYITSLETLIAPSSGWNLYEARAINDKGQITVYASNESGEAHALLLSLITPADNTVPEPGILLLVISSTGLLLCTTGQRKFRFGKKT